MLEAKKRQHEETVAKLEGEIAKIAALLRKLDDAEAEAAAMLGDFQMPGAPVVFEAKPHHNGKDKGKATKGKPGARTGTSEIVRSIIRSFPGAFSIRDVMTAAAQSSDNKVRSLDERSATSTLFNWWQQKRLIQEMPRRGNKPAYYRVKGDSIENMVRKKPKWALEFPLTEMIQETTKCMSDKFTKNELFEELVKRYPKYEARFKIDSVGAKLNTLARENKGVRFVEQKPQGNRYAAL